MYKIIWGKFALLTKKGEFPWGFTSNKNGISYATFSAKSRLYVRHIGGGFTEV